MTYDKANIAAVILAGGKSERMAGLEKPFAKLGDKTLLSHVVEAVTPQVSRCLISLNGDKRRFADFALTCVNDAHQPPRGPLEGVLSAMRFLKDQRSSVRWLLVVPADCPFIPRDLGYSLLKQNKSTVAYACYQGRSHYLCSLWSLSLLADIESYLKTPSYSVHTLLSQLEATEVVFEAETHNPFFNINDRSDLQEAEKLLDTQRY